MFLLLCPPITVPIIDCDALINVPLNLDGEDARDAGGIYYIFL